MLIKVLPNTVMWSEISFQRKITSISSGCQEEIFSIPVNRWLFLFPEHPYRIRNTYHHWRPRKELSSGPSDPNANTVNHSVADSWKSLLLTQVESSNWPERRFLKTKVICDRYKNSYLYHRKTGELIRISEANNCYFPLLRYHRLLWLQLLMLWLLLLWLVAFPWSVCRIKKIK